MNQFNKQFIQKLAELRGSDKIAFHINGISYSYKTLLDIAAEIQEFLPNNLDDIIGLYATDDIRTYASILALWFAGKAYVPLNPRQPREGH